MGSGDELSVTEEWMLSCHSHGSDSHSIERADDSPSAPDGLHLSHKTLLKY